MSDQKKGLDPGSVITAESKLREAIADFVTFEDETSLIWPWTIPAEDILQNEETLQKIAAIIHLDEAGCCDTDELHDVIDRIVGINPVLSQEIGGSRHAGN